MLHYDTKTVYSFTFFLPCYHLPANHHVPQSSKNFIPNSTAYLPGTFGYDLNFLQHYDAGLVVLKAGDDAQVIVSPKYQAKVFTSTASGSEGTSFGWVNYKAFPAAEMPI